MFVKKMTEGQGSHEIFDSWPFHLCHWNVRPLLSDACCLAKGRDALIIWRALFERSELGPLFFWSSIPCTVGRTGRQWFWSTFPERKVDRLPGRNPATQKITLTQELVKQDRQNSLLMLSSWKNSK